jgi:hypothetical protein
MKRLLLFLSIVLCANILSAQTIFEFDNLKYQVNQGTNTVTLIGKGNEVSAIYALNIPSTVINGGITYSVTAIGENAFQFGTVTSVVIGDNVTTIGNNAFYCCYDLASVTFGNNVTTIGDNAFYHCYDLTSVVIGNNVTTIGYSAFYYCYKMTSVVIGNSVTNIASYAFASCSALEDITILAENPPQYGGSAFYSYYLNGKPLTVPFGATGYTPNWGLSGTYSWGKINHKINAGETKELNTTFEITEANKRAVINEGVLKIMPNGQLINKTSTNVGGVIEVVTPATQGLWNFVGAPFSSYDLYAMKLGPGNTDATIVEFDYNTNDWSMNYSYADESHTIGAGEGFFAWPFYSGGITFSTKRDYSAPTTQSKSTTPDFALNNSNVTVTKPVSGNASSGRWMALVNPYPAKLSVNSFITANSLQGPGVYVLTNETNGGEYQEWDYLPDGEINVGQGFFVNLPESGERTITFTKNQISGYDAIPAKSETESEKEFIRFALIEGERESEVLFAHNQEAEEGYDIFDANKMFAMSHVTEPYFVVDGIALVKEEVAELPYYATMNVKSFSSKEVKFSPKYIPQGLSITLIDGEETIDLLQGQEYTTTISAGANANRFKLLIKKSVGLGEVEELDVEITNSNRLVNVSSTEEDLQIEVYNALGQKVFATKDRNFTLNNVSAGAYLVKAFNNKANKTQKIVVK